MVCGATHNFTARSWIEKNQLPTDQLTTPLGVKLADNSPPREATHQTESLPINNEACSFLQSFTVIELDGSDALLGKEWLSKCNPEIDFVTHEVRLKNGFFVANDKNFSPDLPDQR